MLLAVLGLAAATPVAADPLRVFLRAGVKTHGPNQHDHPRFLKEWVPLLSQHGLKADGSMEFPTPAQLDATDVLVIYAQDGMKVTGEDRTRFEAFLKRGGGLVVIHDGVVAADQHDWSKKVQGGSWRWDRPEKERTKWYEGEVGLYFVDTTHPIVKGISNFDWKDEIYYDLDMSPDVRVLATSFESVFILAPQLWTYERTWEGGSQPYRAFVSLAGHEYDVFNTPQYRTILLRGIAWAGKRANVDEFCLPEEIAPDTLAYPPGGPTHPDKEAAKLQVHPEFDLKLVASEPLVEKVISLDWAPDGKLWVAETPEYPGGRTVNRNDAPIFPLRKLDPAKAGATLEERPARDRISWLEDTNGDGRMDKKHVFFEGLELVTSFVFYKDGVIAGAAPDIFWIRDTDGDGTADRVEKLYTGFGTFDTHAVINNFRWGLDGWVYCAVGYSAGHPKSPDGSRDFGQVTAGILRFKPDGSALEQVASGSCNTWGFDFAPDGELFYTTATCGEHLLHIVMPEKVLARGNVGNVRASQVLPDHQKVAPLVHHTRAAYVQIDWVGMFTASAGACFYNGGAWPERFNHMIFHHEPTVSLVHNDVLTVDGPTFIARKEAGREDTEFVAGSDLWFRPIHSRVGPDGALYVVDWYNQAAIHNDTRGPAHGARNAATRPDRDHHFARVWRVQHKQAKAVDGAVLAANQPAQLVKTLASTKNGWARDTAARLLRENPASGDAVGESLRTLAADASADTFARVAAFQTVGVLNEAEGEFLLRSINDPNPAVRKTALKFASERDNSGVTPDAALLRARLRDEDPRARLYAFVALGTCDMSPEVATELVGAWPLLKDKYTQSAALGAVAKDPAVVLDAVFQAQDAGAVADLAGHIGRLVALKGDKGAVVALLGAVARQASAKDGLKQVVVEALARSLAPKVDLDWSPALESALAGLLKSGRPGLAASAVPLVGRWDKKGVLSAQIKPLATALIKQLQDEALGVEERAQVAMNLIGVRQLEPSAIPSLGAILGSSAPAALQLKVAEGRGSVPDAAAGSELVNALGRVSSDLTDSVFGQATRRRESSLALLQALADKKVEVTTISLANQHRLRTHPDAAVAARAKDVLDALRGPARKEKDAILSEFRPKVEQAGANVENGHKLFTANCATCHQFKQEGRDLAPNLTGMGAHGAGELLVHVVDPNRLVEPNFVSTSIETKDDQVYDGIIARENRAELLLRNASGDFTIRKDSIKSRRSSGLSLMPEGFEALTAEGLRDLLGYICADETRFRILDLSPVFNVNTLKGLYMVPENTNDSPFLSKYGLVKVGDVPFDAVSPLKGVNNTLVLQGGDGVAKTYTKSVSIKVGYPIGRLHFLGGIAGWGYPAGGAGARGTVAATVVLHFAGGATESLVFKDGEEFADWIGPFDVPGSKSAGGLAVRGQVRAFSRDIKSREVVENISLESPNNHQAPTFLSITAELGSVSASGAAPTAPSEPAKPQASAAPAGEPQVRTLIVGVGSSHDFPRWFLQEDTKILQATGHAKVDATAKPDDVLTSVPNLDVLFLSNNAPYENPASRQAIMGFLQRGGGIVLVHAGLWYNWPEWPEYNRDLCGGGSRGHDRLGEFEVTVTEPNHPLVKGLPATFKITDELYWFETDPKGAPIKVLATAFSPSKQKAFPMIFEVQQPKKGRVAGIALGHDGAAHTHPAYIRLIQNAMDWAAGR